MQLVPRLNAPHFPSCLFPGTEKRGATVSFLVLGKGGAFWDCGHLPSINPKYQALSPDKSQITLPSGDTLHPPLRSF